MDESILRSGDGSALAHGSPKVFARLPSLRLLALLPHQHPTPGCMTNGMQIFPRPLAAIDANNYPHSLLLATPPTLPLLSQAPLPTTLASYSALPSASSPDTASMWTTLTNSDLLPGITPLANAASDSPSPTSLKTATPTSYSRPPPSSTIQNT